MILFSVLSSLFSCMYTISLSYPAEQLRRSFWSYFCSSPEKTKLWGLKYIDR